MGALTSSIEGEYIVQIFKKLFFCFTILTVYLVTVLLCKLKLFDEDIC